MMESFLEILSRTPSRLWRKSLSLIFLLISSNVYPAFCWGPDGHQYINQNAALKAPIGTDGFPSFFRSEDSIRIITYNGSEPDRWKRFPGYARSRGHSASHYANLDSLQYFPPTNDHLVAIQIYQQRGFDSRVIGLLPYYIMENYEKLRVSFGEYRSAAKRDGANTRPVELNILYYAGLLGHYVGDGSQPLHTTSHNHGWVGENPKGHAMDEGIHRRFEVEFMSHIKVEDFQARINNPSHLHDPFTERVDYLKRTYAFMEKVYELDKAGAISEPTPESLRFVQERLAAASQMLVNLWYTAWLESDQAKQEKFAP